MVALVLAVYVWVALKARGRVLTGKKLLRWNWRWELELGMGARFWTIDTPPGQSNQGRLEYPPGDDDDDDESLRTALLCHRVTTNEATMLDVNKRSHDAKSEQTKPRC